MTTQEATLIAAAIAAFASVVTLAMNLRAQKTSEMRVSYRASLEPYIHELGAALHEIMATSNIYLFRAKSDESRANWRTKHENARDSIKELRLKVRYQLWGIDGGLNTISKVGDHSTHLLDDDKRARELIENASKLRELLDLVIMRSFKRGAPPTIIESLRVKWTARKVSNTFNSYSC